MSDLRIEVEFLAGRCAAADPFEKETPEWPPSPARLFAALAAAAFEMGDGEGLDALRWLEQQGPPTVHASHVTPRFNGRGQSPHHFVPVNDARARERKRVGRVFPSVSVSDPVSQFVWQDCNPSPVHRIVLDRLAAIVPYLGESASSVRVHLTHNESALPAYKPAAVAEVFLRVPFTGQLDELRRNYQMRLNPAAGIQEGYRRRTQEPVSSAQLDHVDNVFIYRIGGRPDYSVTHALQITTAIRQSLVALADRNGEPVPPVLHGHSEDGGLLRRNHVIVAPLPFVSGHRADGRVLGFMIMLPTGLGTEERDACYEAMASLRVLRLNGNEFSLHRCHRDEPTRSLRAYYWTHSARSWTTVTPAVLNRFPGKRADKTLESIIGSMCQHIGLPMPFSFTFQQASFFRAVPHSRHFLIKRPHWRPLPHGHLRLEFSRPVSGPLVIGSCRHYGLGLLMPEINQEL